MIPGVGTLFDVGNLVIYATQGDWANLIMTGISLGINIGVTIKGGNAILDAGDTLSTGGKNSADVIDTNKLNHIFGKQQHNLDPLLDSFAGNQEIAYRALFQATDNYVKSNGITGVFKDAVVNVNGFNITVRGNVIDGVTKIGTAFMA